jgi:monoamine oxidase
MTSALPPGSAIAERLDRKGDSQRVIVIGAGISGLVAALELERAGHRVTIVEARERIGGRIFTQRDANGTAIAEAGAGRIPSSHDWANHYIRQSGVALEPLHPQGLLPVAFIRGQRIVLHPGTNLGHEIGLPAEEQANGGDLAAHYLAPLVARAVASGALGTADWPPASLAPLDALSIADYLRQQGLSERAVSLLTLGAFPTTISPLVLAHVLAHYNRDNLQRVVGGNDRFPQAIAALLKGEILLGSPIHAIRQTPADIAVTMTRRGAQHVLHGDAVICTVPYSVLPSIEIEPGLSEAKRAILRRIRYVAATKIAIRTRKRPWLNEGLSGFAQLDSAAEIWSPQWEGESEGGVLQFYQQGDRALMLDDMDDEDRTRFALSMIERVFPGAGARDIFAGSVSHSWQQDPWARGAYGIPLPGDALLWKDRIAEPEGRLFFAGEHTSNHAAWIEGAVRSGYRAASEVNAIAEQ